MKAKIGTWEVYDEMPEGWRELKCSYWREGYMTICNNKSLFGGERKHGLLKINNNN